MSWTPSALRSTLAAAAFSFLSLAAGSIQAQGVAIGSPLPEFTHRGAEDWLNSPPLSVQQLRGSVVLVDFWARECWNCYRSFPWLNSLASRYAGKGLVVVSVHTPELPSERAKGGVIGSLRQYSITNPVMLDNDYSYWKALGNRYWPAYYLVDEQGLVRFAMVGETHDGDDNARSMESAVELLLDNPPPN